MDETWRRRQLVLRSEESSMRTRVDWLKTKLKLKSDGGFSTVVVHACMMNSCMVVHAFMMNPCMVVHACMMNSCMDG